MPYPGFHHRRTDDMQEQKERPRHIEQDTAGKTETFLTRNVRLITFIVCMAVFLAFFGPWSIGRIVRWIDTVRAEQTEVLISEQQLQGLIERGRELSWKDFEGYTCEVLIDTDMYMCHYDVEGGRYYLWVTAEAKGRPIDSVLLVDTENDYDQREIKAVID